MAGYIVEDVGHLFGGFFQCVEIIAEQFDRQSRLDAGGHLVHALLDRLRDVDALSGQILKEIADSIG
jgi:hypothetical protein